MSITSAKVEKKNEKYKIIFFFFSNRIQLHVVRLMADDFRVGHKVAILREGTRDNDEWSATI